jgi:hypothetical protein
MTKVVTGTITKNIWTPFGTHPISVPVTVTLLCDDNGVPQSVTDVSLGNGGGPIL